MAKRIVDETLKFSIVINGNEAQKEYGKLERANRKLKQETADLEAEAKKLSKANKQNTAEYQNLQKKIQANTQTIQDNKKKMSQYTEEIGINNLTMRQLGKEAGRLKGILSNIDKTTQPEKWAKYSNELQNVRLRQKELGQEMYGTAKTMEEQENALFSLVAGFSQFFDGIKRGNYEYASQGLRAITTGIKGATKAALAFIATPIGATIAVLAGIGAVVKEWVGYNESIKESVILTEQLTKAQGEEADAIRNRNTALAETFRKDEKEQLETAATLVNNLKITYQEAFNVIEDGLVRGQDKNEEYFDSLREYSIFFAQAGFSAQEFKDVISTGYDLKFYKDKLPDAIKEADISLREQTKSTRDALVNAFGAAFTDDLLNRVKKGETTTKDALAEISAQADKTGINVQQNAQLTADLFRGAGEDAGSAIKVFEALNIALNNNEKALTPLEESTKRLSDANRELADAQDEALKSDNYIAFTRELSIFWKKIKTQFYNAVSFITDTFIRVNDKVVSTISGILLVAKKLPEILAKGVKNVATNVLNTIKSLSGLGDVLDKLISFDFSGAKASYQSFKANFDQNFSDIKQSAKDTVQEILKTQKAGQETALKILQTRRQGNAEAVKQEEKTGTNTNPQEEAKRKAEEEKAIADALRKKQRVQEAIDRFNEEQAIKDAVKKYEKDQRAEEEEVLKEEAKFQKLIDQAGKETELVTQLEDQKLLAVQAIRDKYAEIRAQKAQEQEKKIADLDKRFKAESQQAEENYQNAIANAKLTGLRVFRGIVGEHTALGKLLFAFEKAFAIAQVIKSSAAASAKISASASVAKLEAVAASPLTLGQPWVAAITASEIKNQLANKINAGLEIATIVGSAIKGFEEGLYPVRRQQDGKLYQTTLSNNASTQIVGRPTTFLAGEMPEMIIDPTTFKKMDPRITDYILALAGKPTQGYQQGGYQTTSSPITDVAQTAPSETELMMLNVLGQLNEQLQLGIKATTLYGFEDEQKRRNIADKLDSIETESKN